MIASSPPWRAPARFYEVMGTIFPRMKFISIGLFLLATSLSLSAQTANLPPVTPTNQAPMAGVPATAGSPSALTNVPAPDPFSDPLVRQVVARHEKAVAGDKKETKALTADLEKWTQQQPTNYLLLAYLGSAYTLSSRDAWPGPGKLTYLRKGGQCLEAAVAGAPDNPAVRFVRAINYFELPALFGKHRAANDDFQFLVKQLDGLLPMPVSLNAETKQAIYYYAGLSDASFWMRPQAKDAWQRGVQLAPASKLGVKMQAELAKLH
jgi:hypothetical protein